MKTEAEPPMIDVSPLQRYPLVIINLLLMIISGIVAAISSYSLYLRWGDIHFLSIAITIAVNLEIPSLIVSCFLAIVSAMGFIGGLRENILLLTIYSYAMCFLILVSLALSALSFYLPSLSKKTIHDYVTVDLIVHYRDNDDFMRVIDFMQYTFQCCGITDDGYRDWNQNIYFNCSRTNPSFEKCSVPASCCCRQQPDEDMVSVLSRRFCGQDVLSKTQQDAWAKIHTRSCTDAVTARIKASSFYIVIGCSVVTIILTILRSMALNVRKEIVSVTGFYEKYYAAVRRGERKSLAKQQALMNIPKGCVEMKRKRQPAPPKPQPSPAQHRSPVLVHGQPRHALDPDEMESSPMARLP